MRRYTAFALGLALAGSAKAWATAPLTQPANERAEQKTLPMSKVPLWAVLRHAQVSQDDRRGVFAISYPPDVKALNGRSVTLSGFMLPLDASEASTHFLISRYTPVCFFCPPGQPNEVVEVTSTRGVPVTDRMLTVTGRMALENKGDKGLFFQIQQASVR